MFSRFRKAVAVTAAAALLALQMAVPVGANNGEPPSPSLSLTVGEGPHKAGEAVDLIVSLEGVDTSSGQDMTLAFTVTKSQIAEGDVELSYAQDGGSEIRLSLDEGALIGTFTVPADSLDQGSVELGFTARFKTSGKYEISCELTGQGLSDDAAVQVVVPLKLETSIDRNLVIEDSHNFVVTVTLGDYKDALLDGRIEVSGDQITADELSIQGDCSVSRRDESSDDAIYDFDVDSAQDKATCQFKLEVNKPGTYKLVTSIFEAEGGEPLATSESDITVEHRLNWIMPEKILANKKTPFSVTTKQGTLTDQQVELEFTVECLESAEELKTGDVVIHFNNESRELSKSESSSRFTGRTGEFALVDDKLDTAITFKVRGTYVAQARLVAADSEADLGKVDAMTIAVVDNKPTVSFNLPSRLDEGERKTFNVKVKPGDFEGTDFALRFAIERNRIDEDDVDLWYEDDDGGYQRIVLTDPGDQLTAQHDIEDFRADESKSEKEFGFRIRFERTGNFDVTVDLIRVDTGEVLASDTDRVKVEDPDDDEDDDEDEEDKKDRDDEKPAADKPATPTTPAPAPSQPDMSKGTPDDPAVIRDNNTHGSTTAVVSDGVAHVTHQVTSAPTAGNLTIDLMESTVSVAGNPVPVGTHTVAIPASVISQLGAGQDVVIRTAPAELRIPPAVLQAMVADKSDGTARFSLKAVDDGASVARARVSGLSLAGQVVSLSAEVVSGSQAAPVTSFVSPVTLRLSFSTFQVPQHLGVYRLTTTGEWEYVGGRVNSAGRYAEVELSGFSEYAVFEYTQDFVDVAPDHWARADIQLMASRHIVKGKQSGRFEPEAQVTRAEFTALLVRALNLKAEGLFLPAQAVFADVPVSHWSYSEVQAALQYGLVAPASSFRPDDPITRQEMAVMLNRALALRNVPRLGSPADTALARYSDRSQIANWAQDAVSQTTQLGIMGGYPWGTFEPEKTATRAEAVTVLKRLMTVTGDLML